MVQSFQALGRYLLIERIASGGMADVYRAKLIGIEGFEKDVAIKKILPYWSDNKQFIDMLVDEAKLLLHLNHENIVQVYELNKEGDIYFLVMEYVDGVDLRTLQKRLHETGRAFPLPLVCSIISQIALGLQFAHGRTDKNQRSLGIVHRDVSPQNILISLEGQVKITDFGIAKVMGRSSDTATGVLKGKFAYMSPEQALGQSIDSQTDIFALGILMYEMVTGEKCFTGNNDLEILEAVKKSPIVLDNTKYLIPVLMKHILNQALNRDKNGRYQTIDDFIKDLRLLESEQAYWVMPSDLKTFLKEVFPEKYDAHLEVEEELTQRTRIHLETQRYLLSEHIRKTKVLVSRPAIQSAHVDVPMMDLPIKSAQRFRYAMYSVVLIVSLGFVYWNTRPINSLPSRKVTKTVDDFVPIVSPPLSKTIMPISSEEKMVIEDSKPVPLIVSEKNVLSKEQTGYEDQAKPKRAEFGTLFVSAQPWGQVTIPSVVSVAETPFKKTKIPVGKYQLRVDYPPMGKSLSAKINIVPDVTIKCQALFGDNSQIRCY